MPTGAVLRNKIRQTCCCQPDRLERAAGGYPPGARNVAMRESWPTARSKREWAFGRNLARRYGARENALPPRCAHAAGCWSRLTTSKGCAAGSAAAWRGCSARWSPGVPACCASPHPSQTVPQPSSPVISTLRPGRIQSPPARAVTRCRCKPRRARQSMSSTQAEPTLSLAALSGRATRLPSRQSSSRCASNKICVRPSHLEVRRGVLEEPQEVAVQRCGSSSSMRLAGCVGSRSSTSLRYA